MKTTMKIEGLRELDKALSDLVTATSSATGKGVLRRVLQRAGAPIAEGAAAKAPKDTNWLSQSLGVGTRLSARQRKAAGQAAYKTPTGWKRDKSGGVEVYVGAESSPRSIVQEFGSSKEPAQPFLRPAWEANKRQALDTIVQELGQEIMKTAQRAGRRAAAKAARMGR